MMDTLNLFTYLKEHFQEVITDTLLPAKLRTVKDGKELIQDFATTHLSDDAYTSVTVMTGNKSYSNGYSSNYLNDGSIRNPDGTLREQWESRLIASQSQASASGRLAKKTDAGWPWRDPDTVCIEKGQPVLRAP